MWSRVLVLTLLVAPIKALHGPQVISTRRASIVCSTNARPDDASTDEFESNSVTVTDSKPAVSSTGKEAFTAAAYFKELQRILIGTDFGMQVAGLTLLFVAFIVWSNSALGDDPFWQSPVLTP